MADFNRHLLRVQENVEFLKQIRTLQPRNWDWEVTVCYYVAVHLVNAHLAKSNLHPITHDETKKIINPQGVFDNQRLPEKVYEEFMFLTNQSRVSRYMYHPRHKDPLQASVINKNKLKLSEESTNILIAYFNGLYALTIPLV
jgi:hypothetical protein